VSTTTDFPSGANVHRLENGLTVSMERLPYLRSASVGVWVHTGSADELDDENGLAHFLEHLFFKGTETRNVHDLMAAVESRGGHLNAFTSREYTCLYVKTLDEHVAVAIEILADIVKNSVFCDLEKERNVILEEIASVEDTPDEWVFDLLAEHHWPRHPLGRSVSGSTESMLRLGFDDVKRFYDTWYRPGNLYFSIAGNIDEAEVLAQVIAEFGGLPSRELPARHLPPVFQAGVNTVERDVAQAHVCLAFPGPTLHDSERYGCDMVSSILGGGSTSRLFEKIREDEGLAYSIYTFDSFYRTTGTVGVAATVAPQNYAKTLELTFAEIRRLCAEGVGEEELQMNREQIKGGLLMALESTFSRMSRMAKSLMYHGRIVTADEIIANVDAVTAEQVQDFARRTFTPENCALTVLGPTGGHAVERIPL